MTSGALNDDVAFFDKIKGKSPNIAVYSAREKKVTDDKSFGHESSSMYPKMERYYYDLSSRSRFVRAFEAVWLITNNIPDKYFN